MVNLGSVRVMIQCKLTETFAEYVHDHQTNLKKISIEVVSIMICKYKAEI